MLQKINKIKKNSIGIWLSWTILVLVLFPLKNRASDSERVVISPMTDMGLITTRFESEALIVTGKNNTAKIAQDIQMQINLLFSL